MRGSGWGLALGALPLLGACGGNGDSASSAAPAVGNGVDDVTLACEARAPWAHATSDPCLDCLGEVKTEHCSCTPISGACWTQSMAASAACASGPLACEASCAPGDCACTGACYPASGACRTAANALDGCVVAACDPSCR